MACIKIAHVVHGRVPSEIRKKRKEKNWAALCHERHAFRLHMLFMAECQVKLEKKEKKKIGQHFAMNSMHLDCTCCSWQSAK